MLFSKTVRIALANWKAFLKSLLFQFLSLGLFLALAMFAFGPIAHDVLNAFQSNGVNDTIAHTLQSLTEGTFNVEHFLNEDLKNFTLSIKQAFESVPNMWNRVEVSVAICILVYLLYRFFVSFTDVAVGHQINEFMSSNTERPFSWFLIKKAFRSTKFVGLQMLLAIVADTLVIAASVAMAILCMLIFGWWAIIPVIVIGVFLYAVRHAFMAFCLPSVVHNDTTSTKVAFRQGLSLAVEHFNKIFLRTLLVIVVLAVTTGIAYLFNENRWLALAIDTVVNFVLFFILKCLNFVMYYEVNNQPYFFKPILLEGTEQYNQKANRKNKKSK
jgi:hypothetical protein